MIEEFGEMFDSSGDAMCITTNGFVKKDGECVMGKGCALQVQQFLPGIARTLGYKIKAHGNIVQHIGQLRGMHLYSFPVKPMGGKFDGDNAVGHMADKFTVGKAIPGWAMKADVELIAKSARQLVEIADREGYERVLIPRPGCGAGELLWKHVSSILQPILNDRFIVCHNEATRRLRHNRPYR